MEIYVQCLEHVIGRKLGDSMHQNHNYQSVGMGGAEDCQTNGDIGRV